MNRLEEEYKLFENLELTDKEKEMQYLNQKIFDTVRELQNSSAMKTDNYVLLEDDDEDSKKAKKNLLYQRYEETNDEKSKFMNEEELWLNNRLKQSKVKNLKRVKKGNLTEEGFVFENQIDFIKKDVLEELEKQEKIKEYVENNPKTDIEQLKQNLDLDESDNETKEPKKVRKFWKYLKLTFR
jgi:hypothetical protein